MTSQQLRVASPATVLALAGFVATALTSTVPAARLMSDTLAQRTHGGSVGEASEDHETARPVQTALVQPLVAPFFQQNLTQPKQQQVFRVPQADKTVKQITVQKTATPDPRYYNQLRTQMRWMDVKFAGNKLRTPDPVSRIMLAQSAARRAGLHEVGLNYRDVYGIINAETSWVPRTGASKNGTPNLGIAQFEPATAKALGLRNPNDPVEAVHVAALHLKQAAVWSARRIDGLDLTPQQHAAKLREGVSIYYNLSTKGRNKWDGTNTAALPIETQRHISNAAKGAREAAQLSARIREMREQGRAVASDEVRSGIIRTGG